MDEVRESLMSVKKKQQLFKQQQFTFIAALERSREHAHHRTQPVSTVTEVSQASTLSLSLLILTTKQAVKNSKAKICGHLTITFIYLP